ncbi:hypothetical protein Q3V23_00235 [Streptomyces sp. VNUA116]|uniref:hypothetical protein n=1 Tax=Streptomyces sp. VNUA116 TaxID=3062449 RepID=UPI0026766C26|nr:hypothetical protein [Streptomyces sp. VNUA116]WKU42625.1 hypothetical protein Q3V23_00235 [Streptomyces sp. VNUA116]
MSTYADRHSTHIVAGIECDGQDSTCPTMLKRESPVAPSCPEPTTGHPDDPGWAVLQVHTEQVEALARQQGWLMNDQGEFCPACAPSSPLGDDR